MKSQADFKDVMPYASEMLETYRPPRRWTFRIIGNCFAELRNALCTGLAEQTQSSQRAPLPEQLDRETGAELAADSERQAPTISNPKPMAILSEVHPPLPLEIDCGIARLLQRDIANNPPRDWGRLITTASMTTRLEQLKAIVAEPDELQNFPDIADYVHSFTQVIDTGDQTLLGQSLFEKEARIASFLLFLARHKPSQLNELFITAPQADNLSVA